MSGFGSLLGGLGAGGTIGAAIVKLQLDTKTYQGQLAAAEAKTTSSANAMGASTQKYSQLAQTAMLGAGAAVVGLAAVSIKAAADLGESLNKAQVVFGTSAQSVIDFSETTAKSFGIAQTASLEAAAGFGAMAQSAGLTAAESADLSMELVKLAADMASLNNVDPAEMLEKLRGGLAGEAEPLRKFGVFISEARVEAEAFRSGIAQVGDELTDAQKIQARYNIIMEDTVKAQGDFARTSESLPNQLRILTAQLTDLAAQAGGALLPAATELVAGFLNMVEALGPLLDLIGRAGPLLQIFGEALGIIVSPLGFVINLLGGLPHIGLEEFNTQVAKTISNAPMFQTALTAMTDGVSVVGFVTGEAQTAFQKWKNEVVETQQRVVNFAHMSNKEIGEFREDVLADFDQLAGGLTNLSRKWELTAEAAVRATNIIAERQQTIARDLGKLDDLNIGEGLKKKLLELGPDMVHAFITGNRNQREKIRENLRGYDEAMEDTTDEVQDIAHKGGVQTGDQFIVGAIEGIINNSKNLAQAAADAVTKAISAAQQAAGAKSPSQVMMRLGRDMIRGLIIGLASEDEALVKAATEAIEAMTKAVQREFDKMTRAFEKQISKLEGQLSRVQSQASSLRGAVTGGFSSFSDISGAFELPGSEIGGFFQSQVSGAQQFASILQALQVQGASAGLLSKVAEGGPEAIPFAQSLLQQGPGAIAAASAALQTIADLTGATGKSVSEAFFGERIDDLRDRLKDVHSEQREQTRMFELMLRLLDNPERLLRRLEEIRDVIGNITVEVDGQALGNSVHSELIRRGRRNGSLQLT